MRRCSDRRSNVRRRRSTEVTEADPRNQEPEMQNMKGKINTVRPTSADKAAARVARCCPCNDTHGGLLSRTITMVSQTAALALTCDAISGQPPLWGGSVMTSPMARVHTTHIGSMRLSPRWRVAVPKLTRPCGQKEEKQCQKKRTGSVRLTRRSTRTMRSRYGTPKAICRSVPTIPERT